MVKEKKLALWIIKLRSKIREFFKKKLVRVIIEIILYSFMWAFVLSIFINWSIPKLLIPGIGFKFLYDEVIGSIREFIVLSK